MNPTTPILLVRYAIETGLAVATVAEERLMTRPDPRGCMSGRNTLHMSIGPFRLTPMIRRQRSKSRSSQVAASKLAALLTRMSTRPSSSAIRPRTVSIADGSLMSSLAATAELPVPAISAVVSLRSSMSPRTTFAPRSARPDGDRLPDPPGGSCHQCNSSGVWFVNAACRHFICLSIDCSPASGPRRSPSDRGRLA